MPDLNKIIEDLSSLTVAEAADLSKQLEEKWGVTPMAAAAPAAAGGAATAEDKDDFSIMLVSAGDKKIFGRLSHFRRSVYGIRICFEIMKFHFDEDINKIECTKEYLTKNKADLASRATIINFINDEISKGSLTTQVSTKDKRVKIIQPSSELIDEFTMWLDMIYKAA